MNGKSPKDGILSTIELKWNLDLMRCGRIYPNKKNIGFDIILKHVRYSKTILRAITMLKIFALRAKQRVLKKLTKF